MNNNNIFPIGKEDRDEISRDDVAMKNLDDLSEILIRKYLMKNITQKNIALKYFIGDLEKRIIVIALSITNGNQKLASRILGVKETSLSEKIKKYNLKRIKKRISLNLDILNMGEDEISPDLFS